MSSQPEAPPIGLDSDGWKSFQPNPNDPNPNNDLDYTGKGSAFPGSNPVDQKMAKVALDMGKTVNQGADMLATDITGGAEPLPIAAVETSPEMDPQGTIALARLMLSRENLPGWKSDMQDEIGEWQSAAGLVSDGKFGIKSVARMAQEAGILPLVRYWPANTQLLSGLKTYRATVGQTLANVKRNLPDSAAQVLGLEMSIARENGQSYGKENPAPADTLDFVEDVQEAIEDMADEKAERDLTA